MNGWEKLVELVKSTRIERSLISISFIILMCAVADSINKEIVVLIICAALIYSIGGIYNAKKDNDFETKGYSIAIFLLLAVSIIISLSNKIILITIFAWFFLSFFYSKFSRKILFGDSITLSLTHCVVPIVSSGLILGLSELLILKFSVAMFLLMNFIIPFKNVNGAIEDKKRKYKTLITEYKNGEKLTIKLFWAYPVFAVIYSAILISNLIFFLAAPILLLAVVITIFFNNDRKIVAYELSRLIHLLYIFLTVFFISSNSTIVLSIGIVMIMYVVYLVNKLKSYN